ncbi:hypothetical protein NP493_437g04004 [Ridgeia piscesae]|uniref:Uncharacterized protein n=1 Tax=Ridgeia piscesae TaxID=27915 RepID=A0AAD9L1A1_RIDPI|nr:hypothetical protein NP493_437g04004 [Ridgeia piscesae]
MATTRWLVIILAALGSQLIAGMVQGGFAGNVRMKRTSNTDSVPATDFTCDVRTSSTVPTSVHNLRPSDIKVVAAMGDSITVSTTLFLRCTSAKLYIIVIIKC